MNSREFKCEKCGYKIYSFGYDDGKNVCGMCKWLDEFVADPKEREQILLLTRGEKDEDTVESNGPSKSRPVH